MEEFKNINKQNFNEQEEQNSIQNIIFFVMGLVIVILISWYFYKNTRVKSHGEIVFIDAENQHNIMAKPDDPGGLVVNNMDKEVYKAIDQSKDSDNDLSLLPPSEEPVDKHKVILAQETEEENYYNDIDDNAKTVDIKLAQKKVDSINNKDSKNVGKSTLSKIENSGQAISNVKKDIAQNNIAEQKSKNFKIDNNTKAVNTDKSAIEIKESQTKSVNINLQKQDKVLGADSFTQIGSEKNEKVLIDKSQNNKEKQKTSEAVKDSKSISSKNKEDDKNIANKAQAISDILNNNVIATQKTKQFDKEKAFFVQIGSFKNSMNAEKEWKNLTKKYPKVFAKTEHYVSMKNVEGKGIFYRLQIGPYEKESTAFENCKKLKENKISCFVVRPGK